MEIGQAIEGVGQELDGVGQTVQGLGQGIKRLGQVIEGQTSGEGCKSAGTVGQVTEGQFN